MLTIGLFENVRMASVVSFLAAIPESIGLLVFGIGLVVMAVLIRSFLTRNETDKTDPEVTKKA